METHMIECIVRCVTCKKQVCIPMKIEEYITLCTKRSEMYIQDILPDVDPALREMFLSGICPECFAKIKEFEEEEEDE